MTDDKTGIIAYGSMILGTIGVVFGYYQNNLILGLSGVVAVFGGWIITVISNYQMKDEFRHSFYEHHKHLLQSKQPNPTEVNHD